MGDHICTTRSLVAGGLENEMHCYVCCKKTKHIAGYAGVMCDECETLITGDEFSGYLAQRRREVLKLTRRQMGVMFHVQTASIRRYEKVYCPRKYYNFTEKLIKDGLVRCENCHDYRNEIDGGQICNDSLEPIPDKGFGVYCKKYRSKKCQKQ